MRIGFFWERSGTIERASLEEMLRKRVYLRKMTFDEFVEIIVKVIEAAGVRVIRKEAK